MKPRSQTRAALPLLALAWGVQALAGPGDPPEDVTGAAGVSTAVAGPATASGAIAGMGCPTCAPTPALLTQVNSCSQIGSVTRPNAEGSGGGVGPACNHMSDANYQQMVWLNLTGLRVLNDSRAAIAQRMSCLLGVPISAGQVTDALARMSNLLCDTSGTANRAFVVACGSRGIGATASWGGGLPYSPGSPSSDFCGSLTFNDTAVSRVDDAGNRARTAAIGSSSYQSAATNWEFRKTDLVDSILHENTHALGSMLMRTVPGASMSNPPSRSCSVGPLPRQYRPGCRFFDGDRDTRLTMAIGTRGFDESTYRPYATVAAADQQIAYLTREIRSRRGRAEAAIRRRTAGRTLTDAQTRLVTEYEEMQREKARYGAARPCSVALDADPNLIYTDLDNATASACGGAAPSGTFRNESTARAVARDIIASSSCGNVMSRFFDGYRVRRP
ncbi:MAG: hypothetical protein IT285_07505 [Bdellovibrionales bacterium]|nr:hypothetical protein [Bdellovibrionales bacterium]